MPHDKNGVGQTVTLTCVVKEVHSGNATLETAEPMFPSTNGTSIKQFVVVVPDVIGSLVTVEP